MTARRLVAVLLLALVVRVAWPLADPAERLSWSNGVYTDPASIAHAARNHALWGEWIRDDSRDLVFYPLWNGLVRGAYAVGGVGRLPTVWLSAVLGVLAVAGIGRAFGAAPAIAVAGCAWLALFARIPVAENLVAALLAAAAWLAAGRSAARWAAAGAVAGIAAFFGKLHALVFLPALLAFVAARSGRARDALPVAAGFAGVALLWTAVILVPFRAEILDQAARTEELHGAVRWLRSVPAAAAELLWTFRASWLFHRIPVLGTLGLVFVLGTVLEPAARRERLRDGTALLAFWFVAAWAGLLLLPYKAPRYFVPAAVPLVAAGACLLREWWRVEVPRRLPVRVLVPAALAVGLIATESAIQLAARVEERGRAAGTEAGYSRAVEASQAVQFLQSPSVQLGVAAAVGLALAALALGLARGRPAVGRRGVRGLVGVIGLVQALQFADPAAGRRYALEDAKASLAAIVPAGAVLAGTFAPVLVQDGPWTGIPRFGAASEDYAAAGVTHVVLDGKAPAEALAREQPRFSSRLRRVVEWPLRSRHVRAIQLYRAEGAAVPPGPYERAAAALDAGRPADALAQLAARRATGAPEDADHLALEARALFVQGRVAEAGERLDRAIARRPGNPDDWYNRGVLRERSGDAAGAREAWRTALRLDPWDDDPLEALRGPSR